MQFNKCSRCGCFFITDSDVCPNCEPKDLYDISKLKDFLEEADSNTSIEQISCETGISTKNLHRFFSSDKLVNYDFNKPKIEL